VPPTIIGVVGAETVTLATGAGVTVIVAPPLCPSLEAVIIAVPVATAVTRPCASTVAIAVLPETQVTERPVSVFPFASRVVAVACDVPTAVIDVGTSDTLTDATGATLTVIAAVPPCPSLEAVIVVLPAPTAVTRPVVLTDAAVVLLELHVTTRPLRTLPLPSFVTAVSCCVGVIPNTSVAVAGVTVTVATGTGFTVIAGVGLEATDSLVAVIVAVPGATAVTVAGVPFALTVSTALLLETQLMTRPVTRFPFASRVVAVTCWV
jgi:hypothetical protein